MCNKTNSFFFGLLQIIAAVFVMFSSKSLIAATLNVKEVSPDGTIQYAIDMAKNGDTIFLPAGTYKERVEINKSLIIKGEGKDKTKWNFIRYKDEDEKEYPGGIKVFGENIILAIQQIHLHCIENLNTINLNKDSQTNATIHIKDCFFTSDEESWPSIYAQKSTITITDSIFEGINSTGIRVEDRCNLSIGNVKFNKGIGSQSSIYIEKSNANITKSKFVDIEGTCITLEGNDSYLNLINCQFNSCGAYKFPTFWLKNKAKAKSKGCIFKDGNGISIFIENKGNLKLKGKNDFYGNLNIKEPIIKIVNSEVTIGETNDSDEESIFNNIGKYGILLEEGELIASKCKFVGDSENATFIDCRKGSLVLKKCGFGNNKSSIFIEEGGGLHVENCKFGKSRSQTIEIIDLKASDKSLIVECDFSGTANGNCIKVENESNLFVRLCTFEGGKTKSPCIDIYNSHVAFIRCFFKNMNAIAIKGIKNSDLVVKGCEFSSLSNKEDYAIFVKDNSIASIANCVFNWPNNKFFYAKDCKELIFKGMSPEYEKLINQ